MAHPEQRSTRARLEGCEAAPTPVFQRPADRQSNSALGLWSYSDMPEPRLAILGPPAITRRMFEIWEKDRRLQVRFDLRSPFHRRDYLVWFSHEGKSIGVDEVSIAAALEMMRRASSLLSGALRWPSQAAQAIAFPRKDLDAWLAEPIAWELGAQLGGIPTPRVLALLWELRQDVGLHFPNRTSVDVLNYLAWCLTQGIRDRCVPIDLTEPSLAAFLDATDPELGSHLATGHLPVTRLLRIMAPLYDGPYPDIARQFPYSRQARFCMATWVCGALRRRFGWPESFVRQPLRWLTQIAPEASDAFAPIDNRMLGLWELRPDLQARFDLGSHESRAAFLGWFAAGGRKELEPIDSGVSMALREPRAAPSKRAVITASEPAIKRQLCLIGYARLVSGRTEDLHMSGLALRRHGRGWAMLDRLSGQITTESRQVAAVFAEPPHINLVHLNAETAFFDYLFLRERGIERAYTIGYWAWELAKFPAEWASSFAFVDEVWAASRFAYEAIAPATRRPVLLMPPAVAVHAPEPGLKRADFGLPEDKFVFYFSFDFRSYTARKNPLAAVEAFRRAFPRHNAPVFLLLKTIGSDCKRDDRDILLGAVGGDPRILVIDSEFPRPRAIALLALTDCFLSLHRCEGFGRGPAEAMLLGKPVITTAYSGTADFATSETALLVDYQLVPVGAEEYPGADGQVWAEPDIDAAAAAMRRITDDTAFAKRLACAGKSRIRKFYNPTTIGRRYVERMTTIAKAI